MAGFRVVHAPGHARGEVIFFRDSDRVAICGDVVRNMSYLTGLPGVKEPPDEFTYDPAENRRSIRKLAALEPVPDPPRPRPGGHRHGRLHALRRRAARGLPAGRLRRSLGRRFLDLQEREVDNGFDRKRGIDASYLTHQAVSYLVPQVLHSGSQRSAHRYSIHGSSPWRSKSLDRTTLREMTPPNFPSAAGRTMRAPLLLAIERRVASMRGVITCAAASYSPSQKNSRARANESAYSGAIRSVEKNSTSSARVGRPWTATDSSSIGATRRRP